MLEALAPALGCGLMMLVPMAFMARSATHKPHNTSGCHATTDDETAALRGEVARLRRIEAQYATSEEVR